MVISSSSHVLTYDEVARALPSSNLVVSAKFAPLSQSDAPLSCLPPILSQDSIQAFYKGYDVDPRTVSLEQYYLDLSAANAKILSEEKWSVPALSDDMVDAWIQDHGWNFTGSQSLNSDVSYTADYDKDPEGLLDGVESNERKAKIAALKKEIKATDPETYELLKPLFYLLKQVSNQCFDEIELAVRKRISNLNRIKGRPGCGNQRHRIRTKILDSLVKGIRDHILELVPVIDVKRKSYFVIARIGDSVNFKSWLHKLKGLLAHDDISQDTRREVERMIPLLDGFVYVCEGAVQKSHLRRKEFSGRSHQSASKCAAANGRVPKNNTIIKMGESFGHQSGSIDQADKIWLAAKKKGKQVSKRKCGGKCGFNQKKGSITDVKVVTQTPPKDLKGNYLIESPLTGELYGYVDVPTMVPISQKVDTSRYQADHELTQPCPKTIYQRYFIAYNLNTKQARVLPFLQDSGAVLPVRFQVGIPAHEFIHYMQLYYTGSMSEKAISIELTARGYKYSDTAFDQALDLANNCLFSSIAEGLFLLMSLGVKFTHMDETPVDLSSTPKGVGTSGFRKESERHYVICAVSASTEALHCAIYKRSPNRAIEGFKDVFAPIIEASDVLSSDAYQAYKTLTQAKGNQTCNSHLIRIFLDMLEPVFVKLRQIEDKYLKELNKQEAYNKKLGYTLEQEQELNRRFKEHWNSKVNKGLKEVFDSAYCLCRIFEVERDMIKPLWEQVYATSDQFAATGELDPDEREDVCKEVLRIRDTYSRPYYQCIDEALERFRQTCSQTLANTIDYYWKRDENFKLFLTHAEVSPDNNACERQIKRIVTMRKQLRITQSVEHLDRACNFFTCRETFFMQGFGMESWQRLIWFLQDKLFRHALERSVEEWMALEWDPSKMFNLIFTSSIARHAGTAPVFEWFIQFWEIERERLISEGKNIRQMPKAAVEQVIKQLREKAANTLEQELSECCNEPTVHPEPKFEAEPASKIQDDADIQPTAQAKPATKSKTEAAAKTKPKARSRSKSPEQSHGELIEETKISA